MDLRVVTEQCVLVTVALLVLVGVTVEGYMGPSCRRCMHTGDWAACAACYNSRPGVVPFYGMSKRSGSGNPDSGEYPSYDSEDPSIYKVRKRASHLVSYCCMRLHDNSCCEAMGITPYFGKRSMGMGITPYFGKSSTPYFNSYSSYDDCWNSCTLNYDLDYDQCHLICSRK